jgi:hypothetical protein
VFPLQIPVIFRARLPSPWSSEDPAMRMDRLFDFPDLNGEKRTKADIDKKRRCSLPLLY